MFWLRYSIRGLLEARFRSICVAATVIVSALLLLTLIAGVRILSGGTSTNGRLIIVASKIAPFVTSLPVRMQHDLAQLANTQHISPLVLMAASLGTDRLPTALQGVDIVTYRIMNPDMIVDGLALGHPLGRGEAIVGRAFAASHGLHVGDTMVLQIVKSFIPLRTDHLILRVGGIYRQTGSSDDGERQILVDQQMLDDAVLATPGLSSAFLIEAPTGTNPVAISGRIDDAMAATATPTVSGDQSVVMTTLIGRFADVGRVARVIGILTTLVFFAVLVGAANELLLRDQRDHAILQALGFSRRLALGLSSLKWAMAAIGGLALATVQVGGAILLLGGTRLLSAETILPRWDELTLAVGGALGTAALAFIVSLLVTGVLRGKNLGAL